MQSNQPQQQPTIKHPTQQLIDLFATFVKCQDAGMTFEEVTRAWEVATHLRKRRDAEQEQKEGKS